MQHPVVFLGGFLCNRTKGLHTLLFAMSFLADRRFDGVYKKWMRLSCGMLPAFIVYTTFDSISM